MQNENDSYSFQKFFQRYQEEMRNLKQELKKNDGSSSNHAERINSILQFSSKLNEIWTSSEVSAKEKIQKLIFPEAIYYNKQKGAFRTIKINSVFSCIADLQTVSAKKQKGTSRGKSDLSPFVRSRVQVSNFFVQDLELSFNLINSLSTSYDS